jgi:O-antigen ligase
MLVVAALASTALMALLLTLPDVVDTVVAFLRRGQTEEDLMSLTNRTAIYDSVLQLLDGHWLLGYGYRAARAVVIDQQPSGAGVSHAHNAVLEAAVGLGVGGAMLAVLLLLSFLVCSLHLLRSGHGANESGARQRGIEFVALFPPVLANSMLDASFAIEVCPFILVFVVILIDLTQCRVGVTTTRQLPDGQENPLPLQETAFATRDDR